MNLARGYGPLARFILFRQISPDSSLSKEPQIRAYYFYQMIFCSTWKQIFTTVDAFLFISRQNLLERTSFVNNRYDADEIDDLITIVDKQTAISSIASQ